MRPAVYLHLVHFMRSTFIYYFVNHAMVVVPSHTALKLIYILHYKAEIRGCVGVYVS